MLTCSSSSSKKKEKRRRSRDVLLGYVNWSKFESHLLLFVIISIIIIIMFFFFSFFCLFKGPLSFSFSPNTVRILSEYSQLKLE